MSKVFAHYEALRFTLRPPLCWRPVFTMFKPTLLRCCTFIALLASLAAPVVADTVEIKNGARIVGKGDPFSRTENAPY